MILHPAGEFKAEPAAAFREGTVWSIMDSHRPTRGREVSMEAQIISRIQNVFGSFLHHWHAGRLEAAAGLFSREAVVAFPYERIRGRGPEGAIAACRSFRERAGRTLGGGSYRDFYFAQSPAFQVLPNRRQAKGLWEANYYFLSGDGTRSEQGGGRFDVDFAREDGDWRIAGLRFYEMATFLPTPVVGGLSVLGVEPGSLDLLPLDATADAGDAVAIQNLMGEFCHRDLRDVEALWSRSDDVRLEFGGALARTCAGRAAVVRCFEELRALQETNGHFLRIPYLGAPVIRSDGMRATGCWMSQTGILRAKAFGNGGFPVFACEASFLRVDFVREAGEWRIASLREQWLATFPGEVMGRYFGQVDPSKGDVWCAPPRVANHAHRFPLDAYRVQSLLCEWVSGLRRADEAAVVERFFSQDDDAFLDIFGSDSGRVRGYEGIVRHIAEQHRVHGTLRLRALTSHNGSSPLTFLDESGTSATTYWLDRSWTNLRGAFGEEAKHDRFMRFLGVYIWDFTKKDGSWFIRGITWRPYAQLEYRAFDRTRSRGYCSADVPDAWPWPFEDLAVPDSNGPGIRGSEGRP